MLFYIDNIFLLIVFLIIIYLTDKQILQIKILFYILIVSRNISSNIVNFNEYLYLGRTK